MPLTQVCVGGRGLLRAANRSWQTGRRAASSTRTARPGTCPPSSTTACWAASSLPRSQQTSPSAGAQCRPRPHPTLLEACRARAPRHAPTQRVAEVPWSAAGWRLGGGRMPRPPRQSRPVLCDGLNVCRGLAWPQLVRVTHTHTHTHTRVRTHMHTDGLHTHKLVVWQAGRCQRGGKGLERVRPGRHLGLCVDSRGCHRQRGRGARPLQHVRLLAVPGRRGT